MENNEDSYEKETPVSKCYSPVFCALENPPSGIFQTCLGLLFNFSDFLRSASNTVSNGL